MDWVNVDNGGCAPAFIIASLQDFFSVFLHLFRYLLPNVNFILYFCMQIT